MLKTSLPSGNLLVLAYHLGEGRMLKTLLIVTSRIRTAYHLGEGRRAQRCDSRTR